MSCPLIPWKLLLSCSLLALVGSALPTAQAQDTTPIRWRTDYATARKEAEAKSLPLLIDFMKDGCPPCLQMDQVTFSDPRIISLVNQRFIPLKINYTYDRTVPDQLNITAFPTMVTASSDGHILQRKVAFQSADQLQDMLQQTLAMITPPDAMRDKYQIAVKLEASGEFMRAIAHLRDILEDGKPRPLHKDAQELLKKIEKRAEERLAHAKELHTKGKGAEALEVCTDVLRLFPGVPVSREATELMLVISRSDKELPAAQRNKRARELLTQAKDFYKSKDYVPCLDRCDMILATYGDLPEGREAYLLSSEIKNNREWMQNAAAVLTDRLAGVYLSLADSCLKQGDVRQAQQYLQQVITAFPGSRPAESAQIRLNQLQGTVPAQNVVRP